MAESDFFEQPILNSPYEYPARHWQLEDGQPTGVIVDRRRSAEFITPIPKPKRQKVPAQQQFLVFDEGKGISTQENSTTRLRSSTRFAATSTSGG